MNTNIKTLIYPVILFDGECNLCNKTIQFVIKYDKQKQFRFASLQSAFGQSVLTYFKLSVHQTDTFLLLDQGMIFQKSTAAILVLKKLKGRWAIFSVLRFVPLTIRDFFYSCVANNRYKWFGKNISCLVPDKELSKRFIVGE